MSQSDHHTIANTDSSCLWHCRAEISPRIKQPLQSALQLWPTCQRNQWLETLAQFAETVELQWQSRSSEDTAGWPQEEHENKCVQCCH